MHLRQKRLSICPDNHLRPNSLPPKENCPIRTGGRDAREVTYRLASLFAEIETKQRSPMKKTHYFDGVHLRALIAFSYDGDRSGAW
jgi:hypothetical protein